MATPARRLAAGLGAGDVLVGGEAAARLERFLRAGLVGARHVPDATSEAAADALSRERPLAAPDAPALHAPLAGWTPAAASRRG